MKAERRANILTWVALMALLAITCGSSFIPLGKLNLAINLGIAALKALLVFIVFMHLRKERAVIRLVAVVGFLWLAILVGLSATDFVARGW